MSPYMGFYRATPEFASAASSRALGVPGSVDVEAGLFERLRGLTAALPAGCRLVNAYASIGGGAVLGEKGVPGVMIVETENAADLFAITRHYEGYLAFQWAPANAVGGSREEREAWVARNDRVASARP